MKTIILILLSFILVGCSCSCPIAKLENERILSCKDHSSEEVKEECEYYEYQVVGYCHKTFDDQNEVDKCLIGYPHYDNRTSNFNSDFGIVEEIPIILDYWNTYYANPMMR
jgi:hypothetical protein